MAVDQLIIGTFEECFRKYFYDELVVGKLAHSEFKSGINRGDEVDVMMPTTVTLSKYDGEGNLDDPEKVTTSSTKIRIDQGRSFHFYMKDIEKKMIENAPSMGQKVNMVKEFTTDAVKQFAAAVDQAYANLYTRAGHYLSNNGSAITLSASNIKDILAYMQAEFKRGDKNGHTNWIDGQMICIVPPEFQFFLGKIQDLGYVESGHRKMEKGFVAHLAGWDIMVSNNVASVDATGSAKIYYPLFGIKGKTLAGGVSSNLNTKSYMPEKNFNTAYKGYGLFGVGAPRADFLGTAQVKATMSIGA